MTDLQLIPEYDVVDSKGRGNRLNGPWRTRDEAQAHVDWLEGERMRRMKVLADLEQQEEDKRGRMSTNVDRVAYRQAEERIPHRIVTRFVTPWKDVE